MADLYTRVRAELDADPDTLDTLRERRLDAQADLIAALIFTGPGSAARSRCVSRLRSIDSAIAECEAVETMSAGRPHAPVLFSLRAEGSASLSYAQETTRRNVTGLPRAAVIRRPHA